MKPQKLIHSINPATGDTLKSYEPHSASQIEDSLQDAHSCFRSWRRTSFAERAAPMRRAAAYLRENSDRFARLMTVEMGKPIMEAGAEVAKCAWNCDYYAENAEGFLKEEPRVSNASQCYIQFVPIGVVLAVMPWNLPFWQVIRFAAPVLMAGNTAILKHASNVPQCALALEEVFREAGFPKGSFRTLLVASSAVPAMIEDRRIAAVTLTGSEGAGSSVASHAGRVFKKTVLELGGSDPFIVLEDADLEMAVETGVRARFQNTGQSCIAAKRFIIVESIFREFEKRFTGAVRALKVGDPMDRETRIGPLARPDLLDDLDRQVSDSLAAGAKIIEGGGRRPGPGFFYNPTVLTDVPPNVPASREEVFGPVAALMRARNVEEAVRLANDSPYGLGSNLWTSDLERAKRLALDIEAGQVFINGMVASDPRLPFGGVKRSGYGRELSEYGIREFVNIQTVWIGPAAK